RSRAAPGHRASVSPSRHSAWPWPPARDASDDGSSKPPLLKREATPPPRPAATRKKTAVATSTDLRRATEKRPMRASTAAPGRDELSVISQRHHVPAGGSCLDDVGHVLEGAAKSSALHVRQLLDHLAVT